MPKCIIDTYLQEINILEQLPGIDGPSLRVVLDNGAVCYVSGVTPAQSLAAESLLQQDDIANSDHDIDGADFDAGLDGSIADNVENHLPEDVSEPPLEVHLYDNERLTAFTQDFIRRCNKRRMNKGQRQEMWSMVAEWKLFDPAEMQSYDTLSRKLSAALPTPIVYWKVKCLDTGRIFCGKGKHFPEKRFKNKRKYETMSIWTRIKVKDLIRFHAAQHPDAEYIVNGKVDFRKVHLSFTYDGIPNGKSSPDNLTVMGIQIRGCRQVYIPCVRVARRKERKNLSKFLDYFVQECLDLGLTIDYFLADAPMRAFLKCLKGHAGRYSCEYCEAEGVCIHRKICYPSSTMRKPKRTHQQWLSCVDELEEQREELGTCDNVKGITGRSPLLKISRFDMIKKSPSDPFHRDWLGLCKATLWRHTVGLSKGGTLSATGRKITEYVNERYRQLNLPSEFSHRSREIDYANYKGHEWKSMAISCFPYICKIVEELVDHETAHVWLLFTFLVLMYNGPQWAKDEIGEDYLRNLHELAYEQFEEAFGECACTFNWHAFYHLPEISECGKPSEISTEPFESAYGEVQVAYRSGTRNIGLQIVNNMMIKRLNHKQGPGCERRLQLQPREKDVRFDDSIVCDQQFNYYRIVKVENDLMAARKITTKEWTCPTDVNIPMRYVGVCEYISTSDHETLLKTVDVFGKAIITKDYVIIPFTKEILFS